MSLDLKYKIWLESNSHVVFGQGRKELLETIEECKSLNAAAKKLNMSYRAAWGRLRASEERLGIKLVDHVAGGPMHLTMEAKKILSEFKAMEEQLTALILKTSPKLKQFGKINIPFLCHPKKHKKI